MAKIQIREISPAETPMEELSFDVTGNITGGLLTDIAILIDKLLDFSEKVFDACVSGAISQETCDDWL